MICLSSSEAQGLCYIETASLDGETNLKIRRALPLTNTMESLNDLKIEVNCEQPNESLYTFKGNVIMGQDTVPVAVEQILLRVRISNRLTTTGC